MAKGKDTMIPVAKTETFTPVDGLQLGQTDVSSEEILKADKEIQELKEKVKQVQSLESSSLSLHPCFRFCWCLVGCIFSSVWALQPFGVCVCVVGEALSNKVFLFVFHPTEGLGIRGAATSGENL